jgi:tetratricopeptide (TPR) repeat protein
MIRQHLTRTKPRTHPLSSQPHSYNADSRHSQHHLLARCTVPRHLISPTTFVGVVVVLTCLFYPLPGLADQFAATQYLTTSVVSCDTQVRALQHLANTSIDKEAYQSACTAFEAQLILYKLLYPMELFPNGHVSIADTLVDLGQCYRLLGDKLKCKEVWERELTIRRRVSGLDNDIIDSLLRTASAYRDTPEHNSAITYLTEALRTAEALYLLEEFPYGHFNIALINCRIADYYRTHGDLARAINGFESTLTFCRGIAAAHDTVAKDDCVRACYIVYLEALDKLIDLHVSRGNYASAMQECDERQIAAYRLYRQPTDAREAVELTVDLAWAATIYLCQGKSPEALNVLTRQVRMLERLDQTKTVVRRTVAACYRDMAIAHECSGSLGDAQMCAEKALGSV